MRAHRTLLLAAFLLAAGLVALLFVSTRPGEDPRSISTGAEPRRLAVDPGVEDRGEPGEPDASPRIRILELDSPGDPGLPTSDRDASSTANRGNLRAPTVRPFRAGSGRILFAVEDESGSPVPGATVSLRSLEAAGGFDRATADSRGETRFVGLAAGRYAYRVQAPGRSEVGPAHPVRLEEGEYEQVTVRLVGADLRIAGRLLNERGEPVPGIEVSAIRHRFASSVSEAAAEPAVHRALSHADGSFAIRGLAEGEYEVRTRATDRHPSLTAGLQAGRAPVDLILREGLRVAGTVRSARGDLLAGVRVRVHDRRNRLTYTDDEGSYELFLEHLPDEETPTLRFFVQGYEEAQLLLPEPGSDGVVRADAELRALAEGALVSGVVETERGDPVAAASVFLSAPPGTPYQTISSPDGSFSISHVKIGPGYQLRVLPDGHYLDYSMTGIRVPEDGLSLDVVLEALATARLHGRMVDTEGNPVPGFRLWVVIGGATRSAIPVSSDERGYFDIDAAPAGRVSFDTRSSPLLRVSGVTLPADGEADVELVLDWGLHTLVGSVLDEDRRPIAGAQVSLSWSQRDGNTTSRSLRRGLTDDQGRTEFPHPEGRRAARFVLENRVHVEPCPIRRAHPKLVEPRLPRPNRSVRSPRSRPGSPRRSSPAA